MAEYLIKGTTLTSIADAIREKTGTSEEMKTVDFPDKIRSIATGGDEEIGVKSKAVNFYDQFGNIMYSYTRAEAAALTELPPGPEIEGFEFDTWTRTLEDIKSTEFFVDVAPMYKRNGYQCGVLVVDIPSDNLSVCLKFTMDYSSPQAIGIVDWMDGTTKKITGSTSSTSRNFPEANHTYNEAGIKYIAIYRTQGEANIQLGSTLSPRKYTVLMDTTSSYTTDLTLSFYPDFKLLSVLGTTSVVPLLVSGHQRLKMISFGNAPSAYGHNLQLYFAPELEVVATSKYLLDGTNKLRQVPKLRRIAFTELYSNLLVYSDSIRDIYIANKLEGTNAIFAKFYLMPIMNVNRRLIIDLNTPPTQPSSVTNITWGDGLIYVPDSAVETYKANEPFASVVDCIRPISEYPDY